MKANETKRKSCEGKGSKKAPRWDSGVRPVRTHLSRNNFIFSDTSAVF